MGRHDEIERAAVNVRRRWGDELGQSSGPHVFRTHQVAAICSVCVRTVCRWCDEGLLYCYRLPRTGPQPGPRRIPRSGLVAFMRAGGIPSQRPDLLPFDGSAIVLPSWQPQDAPGRTQSIPPNL